MHSYAYNVPAARASEDARAEFIQQTYLHLGLAVLAFAGIEVALFTSGIAAQIWQAMAGAWWVVLFAFVGVSWVADRWARNLGSPAMQYAGLILYVLAEAFIFVPMLYMATSIGEGVLPTAATLTFIVFAGLTGTVFITKKDFSFLGKFLMVASFAAIGFIVAGMIFGFTGGLIFSTAMVALASGYILYYTSNILHHYPVGAHVAAALALFASVALLFYYLLQIVGFASRD